MWCGKSGMCLRDALVWNENTLRYIGESSLNLTYIQAGGISWHSFLATHIRIPVSLYPITLETNLLRIQKIFFESLLRFFNARNIENHYSTMQNITTTE